MFLYGLNQKEKKCFMELAYIAISIDGDIAEEEIDVLENYAVECDLVGFKPNKRSLEMILKDLEGTKEFARRIILIELMSLWTADGKWAEEEIQMMNRVGIALGINNSLLEMMKNWSLQIKKTIDLGYKLIGDS